MKKIVPNMFAKEKAEQFAKMLTERDEDGFTWKSVCDSKGTGKFLVECRDENGGFIEYM